MSEQNGNARLHPDLIVRQASPLNAGPALSHLGASFVTPNELFFIRNHGEVPAVDPASFRVEVQGLVRRPLQLGLDDLRRMPRVELTATLQCAGNRRSELAAVAPIPGELPWGLEAVSNATWAGVRLADVLALAEPCVPVAAAAGTGGGAAGEKAAGTRGEGPAGNGTGGEGPAGNGTWGEEAPAGKVNGDADGEPSLHVAFAGLDETERHGHRFHFGGSIPLRKALAPEVLLAYEMNGKPLPPEHGAPLRALVPGYIGARSVKWLASIRVQETPSSNYFQARAYRLFPAAVVAAPEEAAGWELGMMLGDQSLNSIITSPAEGESVPAGEVEVCGVAMAGAGNLLSRVEVSADGGETWGAARILDERGRWAWRLWRAVVHLEAGERQLICRAWDTAAQTQPESAAHLWNFKGYMNNAWHRVAVTAVG
jgi:sulfite oxidase